jgi:putative heme degradation protein
MNPLRIKSLPNFTAENTVDESTGYLVQVTDATTTTESDDPTDSTSPALKWSTIKAGFKTVVDAHQYMEMVSTDRVQLVKALRSVGLPKDLAVKRFRVRVCVRKTSDEKLVEYIKTMQRGASQT